MFERYTEKARRIIFFGRYEASQFSSPCIETEHLLLGLLREERAAIKKLLPNVEYDAVRKEVEERSNFPDIDRSHLTDLPLTSESKRVLAFAADEAERLSHRHIGPEHLLLGLLHEEPSSHLLKKRGANLSELRQKVADGAWPAPPSTRAAPYVSRETAERYVNVRPLEEIGLHGQPRNADFIRRSVKKLREISWYWQKQDWIPRDIVIHRKTQTVSFDTSLAENPKKFDLVKNGWAKDYCKICHWELFASENEPDHATGYTNGRDWLCIECYDKFIARSDFFSSNYPDIT
jgi:hypothetical protein